MNRVQRITRICRACGRTFALLPSRVKHGEGTFCNKGCQFSRTLEQRLADFTLKGEGDQACWNFTGHLSRAGYGVIGVARRTRQAHTVALELALGRPLLPSEFALHTCDNRKCVRNDGAESYYLVRGISYRRFGHLWVGDNDANMADMDSKGRRAKLFGETNPMLTHPNCVLRGEDNPSSKLTAEQVVEIRKLRGMISGRALAKKYAVSFGLISHIWNGRAWKHLLAGSES